MSGHFIFDYHPRRRLLNLRLAGIWDETILQAFVGEALRLREQVEQAGHHGTGGRILLDLSEFPVQPKNVTEGLGMMLPRFGDSAGKVAVALSSSALQHLQAQRLLAAERVRMFPTVSDAQTWLAEL